MITRTIAGGILAAGLILSSAATGHAGGPDEKFKIDNHFTEVDEFLTEVCGTEITFTLDTGGMVRLWDDGRVHVTEHGSFVLTNTDTGKTLTNSWTGTFKGQSTETFNDDGTLTIRFNDQHMGIPERWTDSDGKVLIFDRGRAVFDGELVIDLETGDLVHLHETITTNGPHPILDQGFLDPALACELLN